MSQNAVTATVVVVSGSTILGAALNPNIDRTRVIFRAVAGGFLLGAVLSLVDMASPDVATALGITIAVAALVHNLPAVTTAINNSVGSGTTTPGGSNVVFLPGVPGAGNKGGKGSSGRISQKG